MKMKQAMCKLFEIIPGKVAFTLVTDKDYICTEVLFEKVACRINRAVNDVLVEEGLLVSSEIALQ